MYRLTQTVRHVVSVSLAAIALVAVGAGVFPPSLASQAKEPPPEPRNSSPLKLADNQSILALALHLKKVGARMYGAYWCPHCTSQKNLFGESAFRNILYIECDPRGQNARPADCKEANISGYPTWEIKGKRYVGTQSLEELAEASGYQGTRNF
jgi:hypothetical protein